MKKNFITNLINQNITYVYYQEIDLHVPEHPIIYGLLISSALQMALLQPKPIHGLLHHADRGSPYASNEYQQLLHLANMDCSVSQKGNRPQMHDLIGRSGYDNAVVENFFATLKRERVYQRNYQTKIQAQQDIFQYIEVRYNRKHNRAERRILLP